MDRGKVKFMYNGIYSFDRDGKIRAIDLDEKYENPLKKFNTLDEFKEVFYKQGTKIPKWPIARACGETL
jgi:hypothetical protein